jgi:prepilin-type N-terminal cleavage/methylation domain-containing protein
LILSRAFTLIEMLVVISVIAILAALIIPVSGAVKKAGIVKRTQTELAQLETAIDSYKAKTGFYPPDNPSNAAVNQLFFELAGTIVTNQGSALGNYSTLDGGGQIAPADIPNVFGPTTGFQNSARDRGGDDSAGASKFLRGFRSAQFGQLTSVPNTVKVIVGPVPWPTDRLPLPIPSALGPASAGSGLVINPWRYNSSSPTNNPSSYDLWIDFYIGGKLYRIGNWSKQPLTP